MAQRLRGDLVEVVSEESLSGPLTGASLLDPRRILKPGRMGLAP